ncbi:hypothetical protein, partial [uncultured Sphingomonas sp.]|uniref:hypothetical protein n=1 Tax=uncultured Sphingomonas sp. TaxID=158754 RepID=UPI0025E1C53A
NKQTGQSINPAIPSERPLSVHVATFRTAPHRCAPSVNSPLRGLPHTVKHFLQFYVARLATD